MYPAAAPTGAERVSGKPKDRQGKVLFINADHEYFEGRAQSFLMSEHIEKIVTTFEAFKEEPGFSAIVDNATLKANGYNLNIRRYADNAPPPEPKEVAIRSAFEGMLSVRLNAPWQWHRSRPIGKGARRHWQ